VMLACCLAPWRGFCSLVGCLARPYYCWLEFAAIVDALARGWEALKESLLGMSLKDLFYQLGMS